MKWIQEDAKFVLEGIFDEEIIEANMVSEMLCIGNLYENPELLKTT